MPEYITDFSEVGVAVKDKLAGLVINSRPVPVRYFDPDLDLAIAEYPLIVMYRSFETRDLSRWSNEKIRDEWIFDPDDPTRPISNSEREHPEPWNIYFGIRLYADKHMDMDAMKMHYLKKFPRGTYLEIKDVKYDVVHYAFDLTGSGYKDFGIQSEGERRLMEQYTFFVEINLDLDLEGKTEAKVVQETNIRITHDMSEGE